VWTAPWGSRRLARDWLRVECVHVFGLLMRRHDRWPRWDPQAHA
jgi:hypothetical protein